MTIKFNNLRAGLSLSDTIAFGKYKGCIVEDVVHSDVKYLKYMHRQKIIFLGRDVLDLIANLPNKYMDASFETGEYDNDRTFDDIPF